MDKIAVEKALLERKIGMTESTLLSEVQVVINQLLYKLDLELHRSTLKWGFGRLLDLAPADLQAKWSAQRAKLEQAIIAGDVPLVEDLVNGSCRGITALERSAVAAGHCPYFPEFKEVVVEDGTVYRVVDDFADAGALEASAERPVVSLTELCRAYHTRHQETFSARPVRVAEGFVPKAFSEDSIPF